MEIIWYGVERFQAFLGKGTISFLSIIVLMILIGVIRIWINRR